jgi:hypothetical protein
MNPNERTSTNPDGVGGGQVLTQDQIARILTLADDYAQQRYRDSNYGTRDGLADRKKLVRYLEQLMQPSGVTGREFPYMDPQAVRERAAGVKEDQRGD